MNHVREKKLEKARSRLRECEEELSDCGNVVKRCREVLQKSEDELKDLKKIVSELEQYFSQWIMLPALYLRLSLLLVVDSILDMAYMAVHTFVQHMHCT